MVNGMACAFSGFCNGEHYWEIEFVEPPYGTSVMVGLGTKQALLHSGKIQFVNLLGESVPYSHFAQSVNANTFQCFHP